MMEGMGGGKEKEVSGAGAERMGGWRGGVAGMRMSSCGSSLRDLRARSGPATEDAHRLRDMSEGS